MLEVTSRVASYFGLCACKIYICIANLVSLVFLQRLARKVVFRSYIIFNVSLLLFFSNCRFILTGLNFANVTLMGLVLDFSSSL